jgi:hypothetical protein
MPKPVILGTTPELLARDGLTDGRVEVWEDGQRASTGPGSFEWWYFDAHFDDESRAVVVLGTKPLLARKGPLKPDLSFTITRPDGTKATQFPLFPPEEFSASKEGCDVRIAKNWVRGDLHRYQVHAETDGSIRERGSDCGGKPMAADLTFTGIVPPWRPGSGKAYFGDLDHYFAWLPAMPFGSVEGTLTYDGKTHSVKGTGYHDHNWGNVGLSDVLDHWYWGRARLGEYTLIFVEQVAAGAFGHVRMPVFMLAKGGEIVTSNLTIDMQARDFVSHSDGRGFPREVDFTWQEGAESVHLRLRRPQLREGVSLLGFLPAWQARLARLITNPYYFRFEAELELVIDLEKVKTSERGPALYEIMILRGKKHP